jgi:hypothetical protein
MTARRDPPRRVTPEVLAFYKKKAQRLRLAAQLRARRRMCRWLARVLCDADYVSIRVMTITWQRQAGVGIHADRCRVDQTVSSGDLRCQISTNGSATRLCVKQRQRAEAKSESGIRHGSPCTAGAKLDNAINLHAVHVTAKTLGEAGPVGVVADPLAVAQQNGIHRTERFCVLRQLRQMRNDRLLAGMGNREASESGALDSQQQVRQSPGRDAQLGQVNEAVDIPKPMGLPFGHLEFGGSGALDVSTDQAEEGRFFGHGKIVCDEL